MIYFLKLKGYGMVAAKRKRYSVRIAKNRQTDEDYKKTH